MNTNEVFNEITSTGKWYGGKLSPQSACRIVRKHKEGKYKNYKWFFGKFGYEFSEQITWIKTETK